jgi:hypothetical protein
MGAVVIAPLIYGTGENNRTPNRGGGRLTSLVHGGCRRGSSNREDTPQLARPPIDGTWWFFRLPRGDNTVDPSANIRRANS